MIRFIAALDIERGIADDTGIPWKGKLPTDVAYYHGKIHSHNYLIGHATYEQHSKPLSGTPTFVATTKTEKLRLGFIKVTDARKFLTDQTEDIWVGGGAGLFASTFDLADELYLTRIDKDFSCTKFFPDFEKDFKLLSKSDTQTENGINFCFEVWHKIVKK